MILYHGTGARRQQSIEKRGLLPKPKSFVYASPLRIVGVIFASARSELEDDWGMVVHLKDRGSWEIDDQFFASLKTPKAITPEEIVKVEIVDPQEELDSFAWLKQVAKAITMEKNDGSTKAFEL